MIFWFNKMAIETELKLRISPEHLARIKRHPLLRSLSAARATTRKLYSVYYDTPDLYLHKHAMALRLRRVGRQWVQTLKGGGSVQAGLHLRNEWEAVVPGAELDFDALETCGATSLPGKVRKNLQAVFVTDFTRTARMLNFEGAQIELCLDSGEIRSGRKARRFAEVELELKAGSPLQLFHLALRLLEIAPLELEGTSKAEYGYRMWTHAQPEIISADEIVLHGSEEIGNVLQGMVWSCLSHLQGNVAGAVADLDDEYLHQIRVALRRLRVVLGMTYGVQADAELGRLRSDIAELAGELGRSREWDVFVAQTLEPLRLSLGNEINIDAVLRGSELRRRKQHKQARELLQSADFQRLQMRLGCWMWGDYWQQACWREQALPDFATQIMRRRSKQVHRLYLSLSADADPLRLHIFRIACKKLRYSAELFSSLYRGKNTARYLSGLARIQDELGLLNDIAIARKMLDEIGVGRMHEATVLIRGWVEHDYADIMGRLHKAWKKFLRCEEFWP